MSVRIRSARVRWLLPATAGALMTLTAACAGAPVAASTVTVTQTVATVTTVTVSAAGGDDMMVTPQAPVVVTPELPQIGGADSGLPMPTIDPGAAARPAPVTSALDPDAVVVNDSATVATVDAAGIITLAAPNATGDLVLDVYEDALCPYCGQFEQQYGAAISDALDSGRITIRYRMMNFLNGASASGDYSTRAFTALLTLAQRDGAVPGAVEAFHRALFLPGVQPQERAASDLTDAQLAGLARSAGASAETAQAIEQQAVRSGAEAAADANLEELRAVAAKAGRNAGTPSVVRDGNLLPVYDGWLTHLLGG